MIFGYFIVVERRNICTNEMFVTKCNLKEIKTEYNVVILRQLKKSALIFGYLVVYRKLK